MLASVPRLTARRIAVAITLIALAGAPGLAAQGEPPATGVEAQPGSAPTQPQPAPPRVLDCWPGETAPDPGAAAEAFDLGSVLSVKVGGLAALLAGGDAGLRCEELRLALNGARLSGPPPAGCDPEHGVVRFALERIEQGREPSWPALLASRSGVTARVEVSITAGDRVLPSDATDRRLVLVNRRYAWIAVIGLIVVLVGFVYLARNSQMLRDSGTGREPLRPYSLARCQTAWWFLLILGGFLFLSLIVGETVTIPASLLGLMGISAGTVVGAELVDSGRRAAGRGAAKPAGRQPEFWRDILSNEHGVTFHRFQMTIWTAALGVLYVIRVFDNLAMPEFDATLLGLMGVSNGTYLGMKIPEPEAGGAPSGS